MNAAKTRHTGAHRCPICNGADGDPRGGTQRCHGYTDDGWAHCSRTELAGSLTRHEGSDTYAHRLSGPCKCGVTHMGATGPAQQHRGGRYAAIVATYDYHGADGSHAFQVVRRGDKTFTQRRKARPTDDPKSIKKDGWISNLQGVDRVPYRLPELLAAPADAIVYVPEGEKDVDNLRSIGLVSTCNPGGAGKWKADYTPYLHGRAVAILVDNDDVGRKHGQEVAKKLHGTAGSIKVVNLLDLPEHGDVSDWLPCHTRDDLEALAASTPPWVPVDDGGGSGNGPARAGDDRRPDLYINDVLTMINGSIDLLDKAVTSAPAPSLWWRDAELTHLVGQPGARTARSVGPVDLGVMLAQRARIMRAGEKKPTLARLTRLDLEQILSHAQQRPDKIRAPELLHVVHVPFIGPNGRVVAVNGYDAPTRLYLDSPAALAGLAVADEPDATDVAAARDLVDRAIVREFQWADQASYAHAWAILLTPALLSLLSPHANIPLFLITKPAPGSGATYFTQVVGALYTGTPAEPQRVPPMDDVDEWAKSVPALLRKAPPLTVLDDVREPISNPVLDALITSRHYSARLLGTNETPTLPNNTVWVATGNNIRPREDTIRRVVLARIDTGLERPEARAFDRDPLVDTIRDRRALLAATLTLIRAWHVAGRPRGDTPPYATFDEWAHTVGGVLHVAGIPGILSNRDSVRAAADEDGGAWGAFLRAVQEFRPGLGIKTGGMVEEVKDFSGQTKGYRFATTEMDQTAPLRLRECIGQRRMLVQLGKALGEQVDRPHTGRVLRRISMHGGSPTYRVEDLPQWPPAACGDGLGMGGDGPPQTVTTPFRRETGPLVTVGDTGDGFSSPGPYRGIQCGSIDGSEGVRIPVSSIGGPESRKPSLPSPTVTLQERNRGDGLPERVIGPSPDRHRTPPAAPSSAESGTERVVI